ncbi:hypothetical protein IQ06DRAFT_336870 [Phaeosphaeriaceae sp. SRC1lsM3a]|nr:hypothetical protein IQ06DRAFT_336870 [Stagonospora sp. SRC1lsM3a]
MATPTPSATSLATLVVPTKIYINEVPEYSLLPSCAEQRVSLIVRSMASGCGDGSRTTSYACFCYSSSSFYDNMIGNEIQTTCGDLEQVTSAHVVYQKYCAIGQTRGILPSSATASTTSLPVSSSTTSDRASSGLLSSTVVVSSPTGSPVPASNKNSSQRTTKIAVGVIVPIAVIAIMIAAFFIYRSRKRRGNHAADSANPGNAASELQGQASAELPAEKYRHEMPTTKAQVETAELP